MRAALVLIALTLPALAGCVQKPSGPLFEPVELVGGAMTLTLPIHIVTVGFDSFDEAQLLAKLRQPIPPYKLLRAEITAQRTPEPLQYKLEYMVHKAPEAFAKELFDYAKSVSTKADPDGWLANYDRYGTYGTIPLGVGAAGVGVTLPAPDPRQYQNSGEQRVCAKGATPAVTANGYVAGPVATPAPPCKQIDRIDATKIERWIAENRAAHGLAWAGAGYSYFVLDSYSKGYLAKDGYHQYTVNDGSKDPSLLNQRAWGGEYDFVFHDVSSAPNSYDIRPWRNVTRAKVTMGGLTDGPIWDYKADPTAFYANLAQNIYDAGRMLWARSPIYPFEYAEKYVLPFYIIIDPNAHTNPKSPFRAIKASDIEKNTNQAVVQKAFQDLVPWAEIEVQFKFIYLPDGDPGLAKAVDDSKHRISEAIVDYGIIKKYIRENWAKYVPDVPGARVYPSFGFSLEYPSPSLFAFSDYDEMGDSFGVFLNFADMFLCLRQFQPVCFTEDIFYNDPASWWAWYNGVLIHELGHSFGLTHPHDTGGIDDEGFTTYEINWLWDSTSSVMTYRHNLPQFNQFDRDLIDRGNAVNLALYVKKGDPRAPKAALDEAEKALAQVRGGDYADALQTARAALGMLPAEQQDMTESIGTPGEAKKVSVMIPTSAYPVGATPVAVPLVGLLANPAVPFAIDGVNAAVISVSVPTGAKALALEYEEKAAPSHARQTALAVLWDKNDDYVTFLLNNGYDKVVLLATDRCSGGCELVVYGVSGENIEYDITLTPYY